MWRARSSSLSSRWAAGDLVGLLADLEMCQHQVGAGVERVQHLRRLAVGEVIEAAPERLAIQRDGPVRPGVPSGSRLVAWRRNTCSTAFGSSPWRI